MVTALANCLTNEIEELAWALIDEHATEEDVHRLEELLLEDSEARQIYIECMQMHAELHYIMNGRQRLPPAIERAIRSSKTAEVKGENANSPNSPRKSSAPLPIFNLPIIVDQYIPLY